MSVGTKGRGYDPVPVEYTGVPFIEAGTYVLECHMGIDSGLWNKKRYAANRNKNEVTYKEPIFLLYNFRVNVRVFFFIDIQTH